MSLSSAEPSEVLGLAAKIAADPVLPPRLRRETTRSLATAEEPALLLRRLQVDAEQYLPTIARSVPTADLSKVVSVDSFIRHYAKPEYRDTFDTPESFAQYVESSTDSDSLLGEAIATPPILLKWYRSWLTPTRSLTGKGGSQLIQDLEMRGEPPVVLLHFSRTSLIRAGVTVRVPCSLDAVPGQNYQWRPGGPASGLTEYIDGDVPSDALSGIEWRR